MRRNRGGFAAAFAVSLALAAPIADAQKSGGVLIMSHFDSPASMSMHEEATGAVNRPMMGVFNNLPLPIDFALTVSMAWHRRAATDPAQSWFRSLLIEAAAA
jgi:DNA-binding transcriptional LysR family regulator